MDFGIGWTKIVLQRFLRKVRRAWNRCSGEVVAGYENWYKVSNCLLKCVSMEHRQVGLSPLWFHSWRLTISFKSQITVSKRRKPVHSYPCLIF